MSKLRLLCTLAALALALALSATVAAASMRKLDARARLAYQQVVAGTPAAAMIEAGQAVNEQAELDCFIVGSVTRAELEARGVTVRTALPGVYTAFIPMHAVESVAALASVQVVEAATIDQAENNNGVVATGVDLLRGLGPDFTGINGQGVIVGMVDTGADWMHEDFRNPDGTTRLLSLWDRPNPAGPPPSLVSGIPFTTGTEFTQADINNALMGGTPVPGRDTDNHGSHVLGSAGGDGSQTGPGSAAAFTYAGMAPKAHLIVGRGSTTGSFSSTAVVDCASYIMQRATQLGMPAVVNISIGSQFGPHDGTHSSEIAYDAMIGPGKMVVLSGGNDRGAAIHGEAIAGAANNFCTMSVTGTSTAARTIVVNGYYNNTENLNVTVTTPNGTVVGPVALGGSTSMVTANGTVYFENGLFLTILGHRQVYIQIDATGTVINGTWTFTFTPVVLGPTNGEVDLWRTTNTNNATANFVIGNTPDRELIGARATGFKTLAAAAWITRRTWMACDGVTYQTYAVDPGNLATFSAPGPTRDGRQKPNVAAPGSGIASVATQDVAGGITCNSTRLLPGLRHRINHGTSMAAPHVTGAVALIYQKYGMADDAFVRDFIAQRAKTDGFTGTAWNRDWGHGKLHLGDMTDPVVTVLSPNGGEVIPVGSPLNLTWSASDPYAGVTGVDLHLSRDGGVTTEIIALNLSNTGSYAWTVTGPVTNDALLRVTARDAAGNTGVDLSDLAWAIVDPPVSTLLARSWSEPSAEGIRVSWEFSDAPSLRGMHVERGLRSGSAEILEVEPRVEGHLVTALDATAEAGRRYEYWLVGHDTQGQEFRFGPVRGETGAGLAFALAVGPSPTRGPATVEFALPRAGEVRVGVYDLSGREVSVLAQGHHAAGRYVAQWNGAASSPAGLYFVRISGPNGRLVQRVAVTR